ncbi:MAG TPA: hypothetical protein V6C95_00220 [Coleofasciculaceae cyanobacterium]
MKFGKFLRQLENSKVYYPKLAKVMGGVTASIFFCKIFHKQSQLKNHQDGVKITVDELEEETGLNCTEQELARHQLLERSLLKERWGSADKTLGEFWVDIDALEQRLNEIDSEALASHSSPQKFMINFKETPSALSNHQISHPEYSHPSREIPLPNTSVEVVENSHSTTRLIKADKFFPVRRQSIAVPVAPNYQFNGPWQSSEQFEEFQRALLDYFKQQGVNNPGGLVFKIIDGMTKGLVSPFWDEFVAGIPLGESQKVKRDWEIEPGIPYPAFEEERIQYYLNRGEPLETAVSKARSDLRHPVLGKDLWEGFLRKCDRLADEAIKAKNLGVATPYLPPSFTNRPEITKERVINKLAAVNPQFSLASSSIDLLKGKQLEASDVENKASELTNDIPTLSSLQDAYKIPMGRTLVERQIAEHPEWGYAIVEGQVVDLFPF